MNWCGGAVVRIDPLKRNAISIRLSATPFGGKRVLTTINHWSGFEVTHMHFRTCGEWLGVDDLLTVRAERYPGPIRREREAGSAVKA
jgi:hypothetical protein